MARTVRKVVQVARLRDQVYQLIKDDLAAGVLRGGQRIVEAELAARYDVSRTPVREALFQLSRDGLLIAAPERGYAVPEDTFETSLQRHEVRDLIDPRLARHSASCATAEQCKAIEKAFKRQQQAHASGDLDKFVEANTEYRAILREMCDNKLLARCSALVDDHAQIMRRDLFASSDNRELELEHCGKLLGPVMSGDPDGAEKAMRDYIAAVRSWKMSHLEKPGVSAAS